jgi:hypothetical protein
MVIDPVTGLIQWTPSEGSDAGTFPITIRVSDLYGLTGELTFDLTLNEVNQPPSIQQIGLKSVNVGQRLSFFAHGSDPDLPHHFLRYTLVGDVPAGASIDPASGQFTWTPSELHGGQSFQITVRVTDNLGLAADDTFQLNVNAPPSLLPIGEKFVNVGQTLTFSVVAMDTPSDFGSYELAFSAPDGAAIDHSDGLFTWTPSAAHQGQSFEITVVVFDPGGFSASETFIIHVAPPLETFFTVTDGNLVVHGTPHDDVLAIRGTGVFGQYEFSGSFGSGTLDGVTGNIQVNLGDGNDRLRINDAHVPGNINLNLGRGQDALTLGDLGTVSTAQNLVIDLGDDGDELLMHRVFTRLDQTINAGPGADHLTIFGLSANGQFWIANSSGGATTLLGGDGDDSIRVAYSVIVGYWAIDGGNGNDWISVRTSASSGGAAILGGLGYDLLQSEINYIVASLTIDGGMDADHLMLNNSILLHSATITGGDGHDRIETVNNTARSLSLSGGAGLDSIDVRSSSLEQLFADLGDDNDALTLQWNVVHGLAQVDGGLGLSDQLLDPGNLFGGVYRKLRFENFI